MQHLYMIVKFCDVISPGIIYLLFNKLNRENFILLRPPNSGQQQEARSQAQWNPNQAWMLMINNNSGVHWAQATQNSKA